MTKFKSTNTPAEPGVGRGHSGGVGTDKHLKASCVEL